MTDFNQKTHDTDVGSHGGLMVYKYSLHPILKDFDI